MTKVPTVTPSATLPTVRATRYVEPLREGGSLPGLMETDDLGTYVVKFRGAGQGTATLVAEIVTGEIGRRLGIRVPDLALVQLDDPIGRSEPDPEIQALLLASGGINLGLDFLPRAFGYDPQGRLPDRDDAAAIIWLDALTVNVDRSWRNPNLLTWHGQLWAIDHGASLLFQHTWPEVDVFARRPYPLDDHVLAPFADALPATDARLAPQVTRSMLAEVLALVPDDWLPGVPGGDARERFVDYLGTRAAASQAWLPAGA